VTVAMTIAVTAQSYYKMHWMYRYSEWWETVSYFTPVILIRY